MKTEHIISRLNNLAPNQYIWMGIPHTQTFDNANHVHSGGRETMLTPKGVHNAHILGSVLRYYAPPLHYIDTSTLIRSIDVGHIVRAKQLTYPIFSRRKDLVERNWGPQLEGKPNKTHKEAYPDYHNDPYRLYMEPAPGAEGAQSIVELEPRAQNYLEEVKHRNGHTLAVLHGGLMRAFYRILSDAPPQIAAEVPVRDHLFIVLNTVAQTVARSEFLGQVSIHELWNDGKML